VIVGATKLGAGEVETTAGVVRDAKTIWIHGGYDLTQDPDHVTDARYDVAVLPLPADLLSLGEHLAAALAGRRDRG
jgi:voltage-gated potassium channel Kch